MSPIPDRIAKKRLQALLADFASRPRPILVVRKSLYWHQRAAGTLLKIITFGGQDRYVSQYVTTLGHTIYVPDDFDAWNPIQALQVLRHEAVHVRQFERYGWIGMILLYGLLPFPLGLAFGRALLEMEAYTETLRATAETQGIAAAKSKYLHDHIIRRFTGPDYAWMWPFPSMIQRWIDRAIDEIERNLPDPEDEISAEDID